MGEAAESEGTDLCCNPAFAPTAAERLVLQRRRAGWGLEHAAANYGVKIPTYAAWEITGEGAPTAFTGIPTVAEFCFLMRRRSRMDANELAAIVSTTGDVVEAMERGDEPCGLLLAHWTTV